MPQKSSATSRLTFNKVVLSLGKHRYKTVSGETYHRILVGLVINGYNRTEKLRRIGH